MSQNLWIFVSRPSLCFESFIVEGRNYEIQKFKCRWPTVSYEGPLWFDFEYES